MTLKRSIQNYSVQLESTQNKVGILFVCMGNVCRSPMAKGVFQHLIEFHQLTEAIFVDAAGTHGHFSGTPPDPRAQACCRQRGFPIGHYLARQIQDADFTRFNQIVAMDRSNYACLRKLSPAAEAGKIRLLLDLAPHLGKQDVPDPYYGSPADFIQVLECIEEAVPQLLNEIRQQHHL
jgi:protein-tyrosine phosphatase